MIITTTTIPLPEDTVEVASDVINIIYQKSGIKLRQKDIVPLVFRDPKEIAEIALKNMKAQINKA